MKAMFSVNVKEATDEKLKILKIWLTFSNWF